jgi:polygalacturonase
MNKVGNRAGEPRPLTRRLMNRSLLAASIAASAPRLARAASVSVTTAGAVGDGQTLNTAAIQSAIDRCAEAGGGTVVFPAGGYVTGTLLLRSRITLRLEAGAALLGSTNLADYRLVDPFIDGTGAAMGYALLAGVDVSDVAIEGAGSIDGRGKETLAARGLNEKSKRPFLIRFVRASNVRLSDVRLRQSAAWMVNFFECRGVTSEGVSILNRAGSNNDGFDIDSCENVRIRNCEIDSGDDAICLKTTSARPCRDISISGCTLKTNCAAIKFGTESMGDFERIEIAGCHITEARLAGIKLLSVDGANIDGVTIRNITMDAGHVAVFLRLGARLKTFRQGDSPLPAGAIRNIAIRGLRAAVDAPGILISGIPGHFVEDVTFDDIDLRLPGGGTVEDAKAEADEAIAAYPEIRMFGPAIPAYGAYVRHARRVTGRNCKFQLATADARPAVALVDADGVEFG